MALDLSTIDPQARIALIKDGERFSSEDTLEQANYTLNGLLLYGSKLIPFGFAPEDAAELGDAREALIQAGVGRESKRIGKKIDTAAYASAMSDAQRIRLRARSVLQGARRVLHRAGKADAFQKIDALLDRDAQAATDADALATQLDSLRTMLLDPLIEEASKARGGAQALIDLDSASKALRGAAETKAEPRGTPAETEKLDLIDGIVVSLVRMAQKAGDAAAKELGEPAIAAAFELSVLYKRKAKKKSDAAPSTEGESNG